MEDRCNRDTHYGPPANQSKHNMHDRKRTQGRAEDQYGNSPQGFTKLNFDGVAKGNPGEARIGGIFRDDGGKIYRVYAMDFGIASKNEDEFHAMDRGLEIAIREGYQSLQIEGDLMLMIETVKQLQQGVPAEKLRKIWRMAWIVTEISHQLRKVAYTIPSHVKRKGNAPADHLVNWGCRKGE